MEPQFLEVRDLGQDGQQKTKTWNISERFGTGFVKQIEIRPGMRLSLKDMLFNHTMQSNPDIGGEFLCFHFCISGFSTTRVTGTNKSVAAQTGFNGITIGRQGLKTQNEIPVKLRNKIITISMSPVYFRELVCYEEDRLPEFLRQLYEEKLPDFCSFTRPSPVSIKAIVEQLFNALATGSVNRLFFEGQMLQLIGNQMDSFRDGGKKNGNPQVRLRSSDIERIHYALELLAGNFADPPTLSDLAIATGMNRFKLNCGFKQVFGKTAFAQLREIRLEKAKQLLVQGDMNVTDVCSAVG